MGESAPKNHPFSYDMSIKKNHPAGYPPAHLRGQVVISFPTLWGSGISWWRTDGAPIEWSLPFPSDVQWRRLVVEVSEAELLKGAERPSPLWVKACKML